MISHAKAKELHDAIVAALDAHDGDDGIDGDAALERARELAGELVRVFEPRSTEDDTGVTYEPIFHSNGAVGYRATREGTKDEVIYLNPSLDADDGIPNVFLYHEVAAAPAYSGAVHHYAVVPIAPDDNDNDNIGMMPPKV